MVNKQ
jgi:hypothetical protein